MNQSPTYIFSLPINVIISSSPARLFALINTISHFGSVKWIDRLILFLQILTMNKMCSSDLSLMLQKSSMTHTPGNKQQVLYTIQHIVRSTIYPAFHLKQLTTDLQPSLEINHNIYTSY